MHVGGNLIYFYKTRLYGTVQMKRSREGDGSVCMCADVRVQMCVCYATAWDCMFEWDCVCVFERG